MSIAARFWAKVDRSGPGCWEWLASRNREGYGWFSLYRRNRKAHRASWMINKGPIPAGLLVLHRCDNPPCVRPDHLYVGTKSDNWRDIKASRALSVTRASYGGKS